MIAKDDGEMPTKQILRAVKSVDHDGHTEKLLFVMCRIELQALKPHNFAIAIFDNIRRIWKTTVSIDLLEKIATENNETGNILSMFENSLRIPNTNIAAPFIFEIIDGKLLWKKKLKDAKYLYGSFDLTLVEDFAEQNEIIREYLLFSALNAQQLDERLESTEKRIHDVTEERDKTMKHFKKGNIKTKRMGNWQDNK
uniref:Uncharacterized protein n=1 Tax=Romanomermis culicivorax TaxID=13658 RepID=A0A915IP85_ROMCU